MRIAVIADVHGNLRALEAVLADLPRHSADRVINLGDCVTGPLWPRETYELLRTLDIPTVRGNHDRWLRKGPWDDPPLSVAFTRSQLAGTQIEWLSALPPTISFDDRVLAVHGTVHDDTCYLLEDAVAGRLALASRDAVEQRLEGVDASLVLCAHSHLQHAASSRGRLIVNPGSVGCPRAADNTSNEGAEPGVLLAQYAIVTSRGDAWSVDFCSVPYDIDAVARRALQNGHVSFSAAFSDVF